MNPIRKFITVNTAKTEWTCSCCNQTFKYCSSPSNIERHFSRFHTKEYEDILKEKKLISEKKKKENYPKLGVFLLNKKNNQEEITNELVDWISHSMRPFSVLTDPSLKEVFRLLNPGFKIPSTETIVKKMTEKYLEEKQEVCFV